MIMAMISGYDSSSISTLFSSLNNSKSSVGSGMNFGINLSDYNLIRSGSYNRLMKAYYATDGAQTKGITSTSTSKDSTKTLAAVESTASELKNTAAELYTTGSKSVFHQKTTVDAEGKATTDYDRDAIYKAVDSFVSDYNALISATEKSNTSSIANTATAMINFTNVNSNILGRIGITVDATDYTLKLDEETFRKSDMSTVKSLFNGSGSYGYSVAVKASMLESYAKTESAKANTYSNTGSYTYNYSTGEIYNNFT